MNLVYDLDSAQEANRALRDLLIETQRERDAWRDLVDEARELLAGAVVDEWSTPINWDAERDEWIEKAAP